MRIKVYGAFNNYVTILGWWCEGRVRDDAKNVTWGREVISQSVTWHYTFAVLACCEGKLKFMKTNFGLKMN